MQQRLIRYNTKPNMGDENAELISAVFAELKAAHPEGLRYLALRLEDDTFIHFVETTTDDGSSGLTKLPAFQAFQSVAPNRRWSAVLPLSAITVCWANPEAEWNRPPTASTI